MREVVESNRKDWKTDYQDPITEEAKADTSTIEEESPIAASLVEEVSQKLNLFHTYGKEAYAIIDMDDHQENWPVRSEKFRLWLSQLYYKQTKMAIKSQTLKDTISTFEGKALFDAPEKQVFVRYTRIGDAVYIDMANKNWQQVEITKYGWRVISGKESPVAFKRTPGMLPLPCPTKGGSLNSLRNFLNLEGEHEWHLIVAWLVGAAQPDGPFPILILQGEQGTAKTTMANLLRDLIDPATVPSRTKPRTERDLAISANAAWVLSYDNLSGLSDSQSDAFCRLATGGGFGTRTLFTDSSETLFNAKRPLIMNGISDIATRQDLADRAIIITLSPISDNARKSEKEIKEAWKHEKPAILGSLCDAVSAALRNEVKVSLQSKPRMADFAIWIAAAEEALPWKTGTFFKEYMLNREMLVDIGLEDDLVGSTILEFMKNRTEWTGTATELLNALNRIAFTSVKKHTDWPKLHNALSRKLMRVAGFLRKRGIEIERANTRPRTITIRKTVPPTPEPESGGHASRDIRFIDHFPKDDFNPPALPGTDGGNFFKSQEVDDADDCDDDFQIPHPAMIPLESPFQCKQADDYHEDHGRKVSEETKIILTPNTIYQGHALEVLKKFQDHSVDCVITSPPYFRLRNYGTDLVIWNEDKNCEHDWSEESLTGQKTPQTKYLAAKEAFTPTRSSFCSKCGAWKGELGAEPTPELYISHLCDIFDEVKRVLKPTGTCFVNIADSYANNGIYIGKYLEKNPDQKNLHSKNSKRYPQSQKGYRGPGVKAKSLVGIPERFVLEMQNRGWIRRNSIIWEKRSCMPSSVKDRFTVDFEYLYFFVKNPKYNFEQQLEPYSESYLNDKRTNGVLRQHLYPNSKYNKMPKFGGNKAAGYGNPTYSGKEYKRGRGRNKRCVWDILPARFPEAHFAVMPEELAKTPIKAGCPEGGIVLDPFAGTATSCKVAQDNGKQFVGIELNPEYIEMAKKRLDQPNIVRISAKNQKGKNRFKRVHILSEHLEKTKQRIESVKPIERESIFEISDLLTAGQADDMRIVNEAKKKKGKIVVLKPPADEKLRMAA